MSPIIPVVRLAPGVTLNGLAPGGIRILSALDQACKVIGQDIWITSGTDSHASGKHPKGEALDVRTKDFDVPTTLRLLRLLQELLGQRFTVLYEVPEKPSDFMLAKVATVNPNATGQHLHLQVKKGTVYPPDDERMVA